MGFWITILGAIIIGMAFSLTSGSRNGGRSGVGGGGSNTPPRRKPISVRTSSMMK